MAPRRIGPVSSVRHRVHEARASGGHGDSHRDRTLGSALFLDAKMPLFESTRS
jgi:hypothetical protein